MLDGFLPELEVADVNHCDKANQFICYSKKVVCLLSFLHSAYTVSQ